MTFLKGHKCVFFDRDGVLNYSKIVKGRPYAPTTVDEFKVIPSSINCVNSLDEMGYLIIVVTNQPDLSTGNLSIDVLDAFHKILRQKMRITDIFYCSHTDKDNCSCRKPKVGLIDKALEKYDIDISKSYLVGDRWRDVDCAYNAGIKSIFIDYGYDEKLTRRPDQIITNVDQVLGHIQSGD